MIGYISALLLDKITLMPTRVYGLYEAFNGLNQFGIALVGLQNDLPTKVGISDDLLIYAVIPWLAHFLHLNVEQATALFSRGSLWLASILAIAGIFLYFKNYIAKLIGVVLILSLVVPHIKIINDVYLIPAVITLGILPLFFYFHKHGKVSFFYIFYLCFAGLLIGYAQYLRSFSSVPIALLVLWFILFDQRLMPLKKLGLVLSLLAGIAISCFHVNYLIHQRDNFISTHAPASNSVETNNHHPLWHSVYIGLGFYPNPYGIAYDDTNGLNKAQQIKPGVVYLSPEYGHILRQAIFDFVSQHPAYFIKITVKKFLRCFGFANIYFWIGAILFLIFLKRNSLRLGLIFALLLAMLPGVLVIPIRIYVSGFVALIYVYAVFGYGHGYLFLHNYYLKRRMKQAPDSLPPKVV